MIQCFVFSLPVCQPAFWRAMARRTALPATPRKPSPRVRDSKPRTQEPAEATDDIETPTKRRRPGRIDIDLAMEMERAAAARAMKVVMEAKKQERNLKRRRQRLLKKASGLSAEDLERIALLKRCGLQPGGEEADEPHGSSKSSPQTKSASPDAQTVAETEIHREATEHPNQDVTTVDDADPGVSRSGSSGDNLIAPATASTTAILPPPEGEPRGSATENEEEDEV